jgi:hypothetical protein
VSRTEASVVQDHRHLLPGLALRPLVLDLSQRGLLGRDGAVLAEPEGSVVDGSPGAGEGGGIELNCRPRPPAETPSEFRGFRFPPDLILLAVRWYLRYSLSYRDLEELLGERGIDVDHVTLFRWVQRFTPPLIDAARPFRHTVGDQWFADETYVKVNGV